MPEQAQAAEAKKLSIKDYVKQVRQNANTLSQQTGRPVDLPSSDDDLMRQILEQSPDQLSRIETSEPRTNPQHPGAEKQSFSGKALDKVAEVGHEVVGPVAGGVAGAAVGGVPGAAIGGAAGKQLQTFIDSMISGKAPSQGAQLKSAATAGLEQGIGEAGGQLIGKAVKSGASAIKGWQAGRAATADTKAIEEMMGAGKASIKPNNEYLSMAKTLSADTSKTLDSQIAAIDEKMATGRVDANKLSADIASARNAIRRSTKVTGAKQIDVSGAQNSVQRLVARVKGNKIMDWSDARTSLKEIREAKGTVPAQSEMYKALEEVEDGLKKGLDEAAKAAGVDKEWTKWNDDYATLSKWQRGYARTLQGKTVPQAEASLTGKTPMKTGVTKIDGAIASRGSKEAKVNKEMIKKAHRALRVIDKQIKTAPVSPKSKVPIEPESEMEMARRQRG